MWHIVHVACISTACYLVVTINALDKEGLKCHEHLKLVHVESTLKCTTNKKRFHIGTCNSIVSVQNVYTTVSMQI